MKLATLETDAVKIAKELKAGIEVAGEDAVKLTAYLQANSGKVIQLAALAGPGSAAVAELGTTLVTLAINAVKQADSAALANGLNITLDQAAIAAVKALIAAIEKI